MTFNNIDSLNLGDLIQILFSKGYNTQVSRDSWDLRNIAVNFKNGGGITEREYRYLLINSLGYDAFKWQNPGTSNRSFPTSKQVNTQEITAKTKEMQVTVEVEWNLWDRVRKAKEKYAMDALELEVMAKLDVAARSVCRRMYADGTGSLGKISSTSVSGGSLVVTLDTTDTTGTGDNGFIGYFEEEEKVIIYEDAGTTEQTPTLSSGTFDYFLVTNKDRDNNQVTLTAYDSSNNALTITGANTIGAGDFIYAEEGQDTIPDQTSVGDYGTATEVMAGLESLTADDGRTVFGMTMSGTTKGTRLNAGGDAINRNDVESILNKVKIAAGRSKYNWDSATSSFETQSALIDEWAADRRFQSHTDNITGLSGYVYQHRDSKVMFVDSEWTPNDRTYFVPRPRNGGEEGESGFAIELRGTEFEHVSVGGQDQFLKPSSSGGYVNNVNVFLNAYGVMVAKHPQAVGCIYNSTN